MWIYTELEKYGASLWLPPRMTAGAGACDAENGHPVLYERKFPTDELEDGSCGSRRGRGITDSLAVWSQGSGREAGKEVRSRPSGENTFVA